jgi:predicted DNA-binding transcriptional regulator YafY
VNQQLCAAIHNRQRLRFRYGGGERIVEPYAYGACETHELLRAFQLSGFSPSRSRGWKMFRVEEISGMAVLDERFSEPQPGYMRNDPCLEVTYCEI